MAEFGQASLGRRETLHDDLKMIVDEAIKIIDFTIVCGYRNQDEQNKAYRSGASKLPWPQGKHNSLPSKAVDMAPYDKRRGLIDWTNYQKFTLMAGIVIGIAHAKGIKIRWGGDWDGDMTMTDQTFDDLAHFELLNNGGSDE